jgi:hypothetical protein
MCKAPPAKPLAWAITVTHRTGKSFLAYCDLTTLPHNRFQIILLHDFS